MADTAPLSPAAAKLTACRLRGDELYGLRDVDVYLSKYTSDQRQAAVAKHLAQRQPLTPEPLVPLLLDRAANCPWKLNRFRMLVRGDKTMAALIKEVRDAIARLPPDEGMDATQALFFYVEDPAQPTGATNASSGWALCTGSMTMSQLHARYRRPSDGMIFITFGPEVAFG